MTKTLHCSDMMPLPHSKSKWTPSSTRRHQRVLELFAKSKIYVGLSESDGISTSILEAMAMAAIPVQISTACCNEWFKDSGVEVTEISVDAVKSAIRQGLALAEDPTNAQVNLKAIELGANAEEAQKTALTYYGL